MPQSRKIPKVISFSNQKGGVGKTTLCREIGLYLAHSRHSTLLIDMDPQANLSQSFWYEEAPNTGSIYHALKSESQASRHAHPLQVQENLCLLAGEIGMAALEKSLVAEIDGYTKLKDLLNHEIFNHYEYILIDSPPSLGHLSVNALAAATHLIIPMNPSIYSMQGTNDLLETVAKVRKSLNPDLSLLGVIINAFDSVPVITRQIRAEIEQSFQGQVFETVLSKSIKVEEAIASGTGLWESGNTKLKGEIAKIGEEFMSKLSAEKAEVAG